MPLYLVFLCEEDVLIESREKYSSTVLVSGLVVILSSPFIYSVKYLSEDEWILDPVTIADVYEPLVCFFFLLLHQKLCLQ